MFINLFDFINFYKSTYYALKFLSILYLVYIIHYNILRICGQSAVSENKKIPQSLANAKLCGILELFKLDCSRRFAGDVIEDSVDMRDFINNP